MPLLCGTIWHRRTNESKLWTNKRKKDARVWLGNLYCFPIEWPMKSHTETENSTFVLVCHSTTIVTTSSSFSSLVSHVVEKEKKSKNWSPSGDLNAFDTLRINKQFRLVRNLYRMTLWCNVSGPQSPISLYRCCVTHTHTLTPINSKQSKYSLNLVFWFWYFECTVQCRLVRHTLHFFYFLFTQLCSAKLTNS